MQLPLHGQAQPALTYGMTGEQKHNVSEILYRLSSADAGSAWAEFIEHFAPLLMNVVSQFEYEQDRANECFLYVCEKLCDRQFHRLKKFNSAGKANFSTWLGTVAFNLCVDWHRKEFGRVQMLPAITALPAFDQSVYRLRFEQGMSLETSFQVLKADFPDLTRKQLSDSISRVHGVLSPRQRWNINLRNQRRSIGAVEPDQLPSPETGPENEAGTRQSHEDLRQAMSHLTTDQRLILHLRFRQGLTLKKIAEIMHLGDPFRARRRLQAALDALSEHFHLAFPSKKK